LNTARAAARVRRRPNIAPEINNTPKDRTATNQLPPFIGFARPAATASLSDGAGVVESAVELPDGSDSAASLVPPSSEVAGCETSSDDEPPPLGSSLSVDDSEWPVAGMNAGSPLKVALTPVPATTSSPAPGS